MRTFLIDLENVKSPGLQGIDRLEADDRVFIFYSENANTLTISTIQAMNRSKANVEYVRLMHSGHNAMDFQIVALLGFLIGSERKGQFCITSMDNGYVSPVEFFMDHAAGSLDVHVLLAGSIQKALNRWSNMEKQEAAKRVVVADPTEMTDEPEEEKAEAEAAAIEEAAQKVAAEAAEIEEAAAVGEDVKVAEPVAEAVVTETAPQIVAEKNEPEKAAESEKPAEPEKTAESAPAPAKRRRGRPRKSSNEQKKNGQAKAAEKVKAEEPAKAKRRPVVVPQAFAAEVHEIVKAHLPEGNQTANEKMVAEAILGTESKNEFYQFLRRALGTNNG